MKWNKISWLSLCLLIGMTVSAQRAEDVLNYSTFGSYGSARVVGVGGAMNAIGADASLVSHNPAALGAFWKSELSLGFGFDSYELTSTLNDGPASSLNKNEFVLDHAAYVHTWVDTDKPAIAQSFGIGFNKLGDFNREFSFDNTNAGSITEYWLARADGFSPNSFDDFQEGLAFDAQALIPLGDDRYTIDYHDAVPENPDILHSQFVREEGYNNEIFIAYGANMNNKWLLGVSLGIPYFKYQTERSYFERDLEDRVPAFEDLEFVENLETTGVGVNLKFGAIYKANDRLRLSAALHSPTYYSVSEEYFNDLYFAFTNPDTDVFMDTLVLSRIGEFDYSAFSAWRGMIGGALLFNKKGFIDVEAEYVGYGNSSYDLTSRDGSTNVDRINEDIVNDQIKDKYNNTFNVKVGGELALDVLRLRAGFRLLGSPYEELDDMGTGYSFGLGLRGKRIYFDAAWTAQSTKRPYRPYPVEGIREQLVIQDIDQSQLVFTLGFKL